MHRAWVALEEGLGFPVPVLDSSVALLTEPLAPRCRHLSPLLSAPFLSSWPGAGTKELLERWMRPTSPQPLKIRLRILRELLKLLALIRNSAYMSFLLPSFLLMDDSLESMCLAPVSKSHPASWPP